MACEEALLLDSNNVKAMYRKALALTIPAGSDLDDYRIAIKLLNKALAIDPYNSVVRKKLIEYQEFLKDQKVKSKETFHSFFKKPAYHDAVPEKNTSGIKEYDELINKGEEVIKDLKSNGKRQEAKKLEKNVKLMKKYKTKAIKEAKEEKEKLLDFDNPTEEMKKNALEHGLDLDDPMIRAELNKLKEKEIRKQSQNKTTKIPKKEVPNTQEDILENSKNFSYKWWIIGIIVIFTGIYFYSPAEKELW